MFNVKAPVRRLWMAALGRRTRSLLKFDLLRMRARARRRGAKNVVPPCDKLHFGCGSVHVREWLNVDVAGSEYDVDLGAGMLPWRDASFHTVASQQVIEHLDLHSELMPLLREVRRTMKPGGTIWLACPDMERVCRSYIESKGTDLVADRQSRWPSFSMEGVPSQHIVNVLFHQDGEHRNLFDYDLLRWVLEETGFTDCERVREADFNTAHPGFPERQDDYHALYVRARVPEA